MSTAGERFKVGIKAAIEGFKELLDTHDVVKSTKKVKEVLNNYLEEEENT